MKKIREDLYFIQGQDDMIPDSHCYLIGSPSSKDVSLVDAGLMGKGNYKVGAIEELGFEFSHIKRVIMTHTHLDHIGCLAEILESIPHAELWVHTVEAEALEQGDERAVYGMDMFESMCQTQYGIKPGHLNSRWIVNSMGEKFWNLGTRNGKFCTSRGIPREASHYMMPKERSLSREILSMRIMPSAGSISTAPMARNSKSPLWHWLK